MKATLTFFGLAVASLALGACGGGGGEGGRTPLASPAVAETPPTRSAPTSPTVTPEAAAIQDFAQAYVELTEKLNPEIKELEADWSEAVEDEDVEAQASLAAEIRDVYEAGHEELLGLEVPPEIEVEYAALVAANLKTVTFWGQVALALRNENPTLLSQLAVQFPEVTAEALAARDLLRKAVGLPPGELPGQD